MLEEEKIESCCNANRGDGCSTPQSKGKEECPVCHEQAKGVLAKTVEHLLTDEAKKELTRFDGFYYCKTPTCEGVYFRDKEILTQKDLSVVVGLKEGASPATVCYCFEWSKEKIREELVEKGETVALKDIKAKMENPGCSCEIHNPSGGCCLGDVSKAIKDIRRNLGLLDI